jgi:hypothetical protein
VQTPFAPTAKVSTDLVALNQMKQAPHSTYSRDLAPFGFFLFTHLKRMLMRYHVDRPSELRVGFPVILSEIRTEKSKVVFLDWIS